MRKKTIVVVDDSPIVLELAAAVLATSGHNVVAHDESFGLFGALLKLRPDLIVLDLDMPIMTGDQMVSELRRVLGDRTPAVLIHSAAKDAEHRARLCRLPLVRKGDRSGLLSMACKLLTEA